MNKLLFLLLTAAGTIVIGSVVIYSVESQHPDSQISTMLDAVWWTVATAEYGDMILNPAFDYTKSKLAKHHAYADSTIPPAKSNSDTAFTASTFAHKYKDVQFTGKRVSVVIKIAGESENTNPSKRAKEIRYLQSYVLKFLSFSNAVNVVSDQQKNEITAQIHTELIPILEKRRDVISVTVLEEIQEITKEELDELPPKKQQHEGRGIDEIQCKPDYILMVKSSGDPACVKSMSAEKLVLRGWGEIYQQ